MLARELKRPSFAISVVFRIAIDYITKMRERESEGSARERY